MRYFIFRDCNFSPISQMNVSLLDAMVGFLAQLSARMLVMKLLDLVVKVPKSINNWQFFPRNLICPFVAQF